MTGKVWRGSKKLLAYALTLVMVVGMMQTVPMVRAEEENTDITFTLATTKIYNIANQTLKFAVKSSSSKPIKYYVRGAHEDENLEAFFKSGKAQVLSSGTGDVSSGMYSPIYVWYVTGNDPYTTIVRVKFL